MAALQLQGAQCRTIQKIIALQLSSVQTREDGLEKNKKDNVYKMVLKKLWVCSRAVGEKDTSLVIYHTRTWLKLFCCPKYAKEK